MAGPCCRLGLYGTGILLILSRLVSILLRAYEAQLFRGRMLDVIDGRIEQEYLAKAVKERLSPSQADGFQTPLPAYVSDQSREHFAMAISPATADNIPATAHENNTGTPAVAVTAG